MKYQAFISYAHADAKIATRLHRSLERYKAPKPATRNPEDAKLSRRLSPIFLDNTELSAAPDLSETIQAALIESEYLIVLCSPAAKASRWVNEEIRLFREIHSEKRILCALVSGTPKTSFPPALTETGQEPLAANLVVGNYRQGTLQLAARLLETPYDSLVQRDLQRSRRSVTMITSAAMAIVLVMGTLTVFALQARKLADQRRLDAEGMVEFMLTDLKDKLDAVGRLDALEAVGNKAAAYYEGYPLKTHNDDALARRANVFNYLGEIQDKLGNTDAANGYTRQAYDATALLVQRAPRSADRIFDHAQSAFWQGYGFYAREDYAQAKTYYAEYLSLATRLKSVDEVQERPEQELSFARTNMGAVEMELGNLEAAKGHYIAALDTKMELLGTQNDDTERAISVANAQGHLASLSLKTGDLHDAIERWFIADQIIDEKRSKHPKDATLIHQSLIQARSLARLLHLNGQTDAASARLKRGIGLADEIFARDKTNVIIRYEKVLLDCFAAELDFLGEKSEAARKSLANIEETLNGFPDSFFDTFSYRVLKSSVVTLQSYADLERGGSSENAAALRLYSVLEKFEISSAEDLGNTPYLATPLLLAHVIAPTDTTINIVTELCNGTNTDLNVYQAAALSGLRDQRQCAAAKSVVTAETLIHAASNIKNIRD